MTGRETERTRTGRDIARSRTYSRRERKGMTGEIQGDAARDREIQGGTGR